MPFEAQFEFCISQDDLDKYDVGEKVQSSTQVAGHMPCCLRVYPKGRITDNNKVCVLLVVQPKEDWAIGWKFEAVNFSITFVNHTDQTKNSTFSDTCNFNQEGVCRGARRFPHDSLREKGYVSDTNGLTLRASVAGSSLGTEPTKIPMTCDGPGNLSSRLWNESQFTDVIVATEGGQQVHCHRAVLASGSSVFNRMLQTNFKEGASSSIVIHDVQEVELRALLEYLYKGTIAEDANKTRLMQLADMYDMPSLAIRCGKQMAEQMKPDNVRSVMAALRKRGRSEALDDIYKVAKAKVHADPSLIDAFIEGD